MNKVELMAIDQFIKTIISGSSRCRSCVLNHDGFCYFGAKCLTTDLSLYRPQSCMEQIQEAVKVKENEK